MADDSNIKKEKITSTSLLQLTVKQSIISAQFIVMMWNELYNTLGASWRQRKRLFRDLQWTYQYHSKYYMFTNVYYSNNYFKDKKWYKINHNYCKNDDEDDEENEDVIAFGPFTPRCIGISTSSRCVIRCPLNSFWRTLAIVPIESNNNNNYSHNINNLNDTDCNNRQSSYHTYVFDQTLDDLALPHIIPYLSPQCYYNYVTQYQFIHNTTESYEDNEVQQYKKPTRIAHSYSDDVWNVSILILQVALSGFDVRCLMPKHETTQKCKINHSSLYTEIVHFLISQFHMIPQAAYNFIYAALYHFERLVLSQQQHQQAQKQKQKRWDQQKQQSHQQQNMSLSPQHLARQWLLYLRDMYGSDFVQTFIKNQMVTKALRWRRQDRWTAFVSTFGTNRKSISKEINDRLNVNKNLNAQRKVCAKRNDFTLLSATNTTHFCQNERMAALIALPSVKQLMNSKVQETVKGKQIVPLWNHFELAWWEECQLWLKKVVSQSIAQLDVRACNSTCRRVAFDSYMCLITYSIASMFATNLSSCTNKLPFCIAMHPFLRDVRKLQQLRLLRLTNLQTCMKESQMRNCKQCKDNQLFVCHHQPLSSIFLSSSFIQEFTKNANNQLYRRQLYKKMQLHQHLLQQWQQQSNIYSGTDDKSSDIDLDKYLASLHLTDSYLSFSQQQTLNEQAKAKPIAQVHETNQKYDTHFQYAQLKYIAQLRLLLYKQIASWQDEISNNKSKISLTNNINKSTYIVNDFLVQKYWEWYFVKREKNYKNNSTEWEYEKEEQKLQRTLHSPIPPTLRSICWFALLQIPLCVFTATEASLQRQPSPDLSRNKAALHLQEQSKKLMKQCPWDVHSCVLSFERQLSVDLPRCHQQLSLLHTPEAHASLRRCIRGWYKLNKEQWSYWQGIDSVAAVLFSITPFNEKVVTLQLHQMIQTFVAHDFDHEPNLAHYRIYQQRNSNSMYTDTLINRKPLKDMHDSLHALTLFLHYIDPQLAHHLFYSIKCDVHLFAVGWFVTLFAHHFTLDEVYNIWDVLLTHSFHYSHCLLCIAVAFIVVRRSTLLHGDFVQCLSVLNHINGKRTTQSEKCSSDNNNNKENVKDGQCNMDYIHTVLSTALKIMYAFPSSVMEKSCSAPYYIHSHERVYTCNANTYTDEHFKTEKVVRSKQTGDSNDCNIENGNKNQQIYMQELNKAQQMYSVLLLPTSIVVSAFRHEPLRWDFMSLDNVYHDRPPHWTDTGVFLVQVEIITDNHDNTTLHQQNANEVTTSFRTLHDRDDRRSKRIVGALHVSLDLRINAITSQQIIQLQQNTLKQKKQQQEEHKKAQLQQTKGKQQQTVEPAQQKLNLSHSQRARLIEDAAVSLFQQLRQPMLATIPPLSVYGANNKIGNNHNGVPQKHVSNASANDTNCIDDLNTAPHVILVHTNNCTCTDHCTINQSNKCTIEQEQLYLQQFAMQLQKFKVPHVSILFGGQSALYDELPHIFV